MIIFARQRLTSGGERLPHGAKEDEEEGETDEEPPP